MTSARLSAICSLRLLGAGLDGASSKFISALGLGGARAGVLLGVDDALDGDGGALDAVGFNELIDF